MTKNQPYQWIYGEYQWQIFLIQHQVSISRNLSWDKKKLDNFLDDYIKTVNQAIQFILNLDVSDPNDQVTMYPEFPF